jgi:hypothetical protein
MRDSRETLDILCDFRGGFCKLKDGSTVKGKQLLNDDLI